MHRLSLSQKRARSAPPLESNRDQAGLAGMTCEAADSVENMQRYTTVFRGWEDGCCTIERGETSRHHAADGPEQDLDVVRWGYAPARVLNPYE